MPSPFPGMDPFLESPDWFPDLHSSMITFIKGELQARLPESYYARSDQRVWLDLGYRHVEPDVNVIRTSGRKPMRRRRVADEGGVALAEVSAAVPTVIRVETIAGDPVQQSYLEIHHRQGTNDIIVAVIEILSQSNKTPGDKGQGLYVAKQQETLQSPVHLLEIDLLRAGTHATAVPRDLAVAQVDPFDYHVCVHRYNDHKAFYVYPIKLQDRLPVIAVPLRPGDPDVALDLQAAFDRAYDLGPYDRAVRYDLATVDPPLHPARVKWVKGRLAAR
jgi:hypothetical protein